MPLLHNELRALWQQAGYHTKMGSAAVVPPPSSKFKRLYHFTTAEHAVSDIVFSRLKVALLNQLNDPFELLSARFMNNRDIRSVIRKHKDQLAQEFGLLCFSADWTDPVLWTHYADKHKGMCFGFDVPVGEALKVEYQEARIEIANGRILDNDLEEQLLKTKYLSWEYEQEYRVQVRLTNADKEEALYFEKIGSRIHLAEVILGARCTSSVNEVRRIVNMQHADVVTFQSRLADGSFHIVPFESTIPSTASHKQKR